MFQRDSQLPQYEYVSQSYHRNQNHSQKQRINKAISYGAALYQEIHDDSNSVGRQ